MTKFRKIVCPTDFSPTAHRAAQYAAELAKTFGAELVLLHVVPEMTYPMRSLGTVTAFPNLREELHKRAQEEIDEERAKLDPAAKITTLLADGEAHEATLEFAKRTGADLIVLGTHGHTGLRHMFLGSTAERVVRLSTCPVLTVRTPD